MLIYILIRNIKALRNKYKDDFMKKHTIKLSFMSAFLKASAYALQDQPVVNAGNYYETHCLWL